MKTVGIYIHIPFCKKKCNYCDFVSMSLRAPIYRGEAISNTEYIDAYLSALSKEISSFPLSTFHFLPSTIYIGGGTPSILSCRQIEYLFTKLYESLFPNKYSPRTDDRVGIFDEITFECNPESINQEKLRVLKSCGVNRLSFGVQSFDDVELKFLGRIHTSDEFAKKYELARKIGFSNISIDLIYGLPGQQIESWHKNLEKAISLQPEHISIYPLTIEENTEFFYNGVRTSDEVQKEMYDFARKFLCENNYIHYEISNFSKASQPSFESKHNLNYWRCGEYLGFGISSASYFQGRRWSNTSNIEKYILNPTAAKESEEAIDYSLQMKEKIILGLRLIKEGVELTQDILESFGEKIKQLSESGIIKISGSKMKIADDYIYISNRVMSEFV